MATKGERQALLFLAALAMLGAATRVFRARPGDADTAAVDGQIAAVEQARRTPGRRKPRAKEATQAEDNAARPSLTVSRIDLDRATTDEIEKLPGIGPALARRITDDRDRNGAFGCLAALDAVKGIGPALLGRLDSLVTFSGAGRPACASGVPYLTGRERR